MNGGDTDTGGAKVNSNNTPSLTPQPDTSTASDAEAESILTISHDDHLTSVGPQPISQPATAEPAVPPTPPVQPAPPTATSASITQPTSSTTPIPSVTNLFQPAPQAPQSVEQPVPPVVAPTNPPTNQAAPTISTQSPQPPTSSIFPSQQPAQFSTQPIPADNSDVILESSTPKKSRKPLIIVLICLAVLAIGAIAAFVIFRSSYNDNSDSSSSQNDNGPFTTKEEVYDALYDFDYQYYSDIITTYNHYIGLKPNMKMLENTVLSPFEKGGVIIEEMEEANQAYDNISSRIPAQLDNDKINMQPVKESIAKSLQALTTNISTINDFYNAYISPLEKDPRPTVCTKTPAMESLEQGSTAEAAQKYYTLYCQTIESLSQYADTEAFQQSIRPLADDALEALNNTLIDVPSAEKDIANILKELKQ